MHTSGSRLILAPTDLSNFLACPHTTTLDVARVLGGPGPPKFDDPGVEVLRRRGEEHERVVLDGFHAEGLSVVAIADEWSDRPRESWPEAATRWQARAEETLRAMRDGVDVIHQACFFDGTWVGLPDFLRKVEGSSDLGGYSYEVIDAKLAREAKAGAVLQVTLYSTMLADAQGVDPESMYLALGRRGGEMERFRYHEFAAYMRSLRGRLARSVDTAEGRLDDGVGTGDVPTYPEPVPHCDICQWRPVCRKQWRRDDHLSLVAGIAKKQRADLEAGGVDTLEALARAGSPPPRARSGIRASTWERIHHQARIQLEGRQREGHLYELLDPTEGQGLLALPEPSEGDLFFDIEGDPHAFDDGLEYLLGWVDAAASFDGLWALTPDSEKECFEAFIDKVMERWEQWPDLHVYHYAAYEQTAVKRLASKYGTREDEVDRLLRGEVFVDLYRVVRNGLRASVESYSIKKLEPLYGFEREVDLRVASSALANFEAWLQMGGEGEGADALLTEIEGYNRDDCVSTLRLRDWLEERRRELEQEHGSFARPSPAESEAGEDRRSEDERVRAIFERLTDGTPADPSDRTAEDQARWTLAHLLSFHRREKRSMWWEFFRLRELAPEELIEESKPVGAMELDAELGSEKRSKIFRYRFPPQDFALSGGDKARDPGTGGSVGHILAIDPDAGGVELKRGPTLLKGPHPIGMIPLDNVPDTPRDESLWRLGEAVAEAGLGEASHGLASDLLLRRVPRAGQAEGERLRDPGESNLEAARRLALTLDNTVLPIQGPPGSGKTYIGARMITRLLAEGRRVGVTATGHKVITNLLDEVCAVAEEEGVEVRGVQKGSERSGCSHDSIEITSKNERVAAALSEEGANLAAGTTWLWAREEMADSVDVLFVDEAGQIALANVLAAAQASGSIVLLGDPQQLDQPTKGTHPPGTGGSALDHLVGGPTLEGDRGLFLGETWRLHPEICAFTSELYYEGRLSSRAELARQRLNGAGAIDGTGLRFVPVEHEGNRNESPEEVDAVCGIVRDLLDGDATWVDKEATERPIGLDDILVVAPYNAQVDLLRDALPDGAKVGTVDKFQGQQAAIVILSMAASSVADAPRGMDFLFNPNRLNVATSRGRCLVVVVGAPSLLNVDCTSVKQMRLANGVCRFAERAGHEW